MTHASLRRRSVIRALALSIGAGSMACDRSPVIRAVRSDSAGVEIVTNAGEDIGLDFHFEARGEVFRDTVQARSLGAFVRRVADSGDGLFYILDTAQQALAMGHLNGDRPVVVQRIPLPRLGHPVAIAALDDGAAVYDSSTNQLVRVSRNGETRGAVTMPEFFDGAALEQVHGSLIMSGFRFTSRDSSALQVVRWGAADTLIIRTLTIPVAHVRYENCADTLRVPPLLVGRLPWSTRDSRLAIAMPPLYDIEVFRGTTLVRRIRRSIMPAIGSLYWALREAEAMGDRHRSGRATCRVPPIEVANKRGYAEYVPLIAQLKVFPSGEIWALRSLPGKPLGLIDVFDDTGEYTGTLPPGTPWPVVVSHDGQMLGLTASVLGHTVVKYVPSAAN